ncbi:MAG: NADH-quinone oxidoreductase subunit C, partial [Trebonia sp.]
MTQDLMTTGAAPGAVTTFGVESPHLEAVVRDLGGLRLADMFATDGEEPVLRLVWANDTRGQAGYVVTETPLGGDEYPALSDIAPAAFVEECEIYEQFGIRPATGKPLNRIMLPPHTDLPTLGRKPPSEPEEVRAPHTVAGQAFEFPFGPVRQAGVESLYYGLVTSGEEVVDLFLFTWHKHRGLEWRLRGKTPQQALFFAERAEGLSAVAQGWAVAAAVEAAARAASADEAQRTRAVALELERLYNHAAAMAALCQSTGLSVGQSAAEIALERLLRLNARAFGHRYLFGVVAVGGASRAPDAEAIRADLPGAYGEFKRAAEALLSTNSFLDRLEATGILTADQARGLGLVGPVARATGLAADTRLVPGGPYRTEDGTEPVVPTGTAGDVLARFNVML